MPLLENEVGGRGLSLLKGVLRGSNSADRSFPAAFALRLDGALDGSDTAGVAGGKAGVALADDRP